MLVNFSASHAIQLARCLVLCFICQRRSSQIVQMTLKVVAHSPGKVARFTQWQQLHILKLQPAEKERHDSRKYSDVISLISVCGQ